MTETDKDKFPDPEEHKGISLTLEEWKQIVPEDRLWEDTGGYPGVLPGEEVVETMFELLNKGELSISRQMCIGYANTLRRKQVQKWKEEKSKQLLSSKIDLSDFKG